MLTEHDLGTQRNLELGSCCPRRVTIIGIDEKFVHFQTRDLMKHQMPKEEFEAISYRV